MLLAALVLGVSNANKDDAPPGPAELAEPVTGLTWEQLQTNIRLTWDAPTGTSLQILRYEISRNINGTGWSILPVTVGPGSTGFTDTTTLTGTNRYQYRVRVLYTSGQASEYRYTGTNFFTR